VTRPIDARLWTKIRNWSEDMLVEWEERAAILEYDGGSHRMVAEQKAYEELTQQSPQRRLSGSR
jgi:hypothetical protein